jgi:predicted ArsR family transcriptional regulator
MKGRSLKLLRILKTEGQKTSQEIARTLKITSMGARQSLLKLREQQLVIDYSKATKKGRPNQYWQLTEQGHEQFDSRYEQLSIELLDSAQALYGSQAVIELISDRDRKTLLEYSKYLLDAANMKTKLARLNELRNRDGFMSELSVQENSDWLFTQHHCPVRRVAKTCQQICHSEQALFEKLLGDKVDVKRISHISNGDQACQYQFRVKHSLEALDDDNSEHNELMVLELCE